MVAQAYFSWVDSRGGHDPASMGGGSFLKKLEKTQPSFRLVLTRTLIQSPFSPV